MRQASQRQGDHNMPSLTPEEQKRLLGERQGDAWKCHQCKQQLSRGYCRSCDEFYFTCECRDKTTGHEDHRTY